MTWNYSTLNAQIQRAVAGEFSLSPATSVLALSALSKMDWRSDWRNDGAELTDAEYDTVDAWVSKAILELIQVSECSSGGNMKAMLAHIESAGVNGGSTVNGDVIRPLNTIVYNDDSLVTELSSNYFKVSTDGTYRIHAISSTFSSGYCSLALWTSSYYLTEGPMCSGDQQQMLDVVDLEADTYYCLYVNCSVANAGDGLGHARSRQLNVERYATLELELLVDGS